MSTKLETFIKPKLKTDLPDIRPGDTIRVYQKISEPTSAPAKAPAKGGALAGREDKGKIQAFEGLVIARKHGKEMGATITVRKVVSGIGVERIFPLHSPAIYRIEVLKRGKVKRAKLYYLRKAKGKRARLRKKEFAKIIPEEKTENNETGKMI